MIESAERIKQVGEYYFSGKLSSIRDMISNGKDIINMGIGSPDIYPPSVVIDALAKSSANDEAHGYQPYRGIPELRSAISEWYMHHFVFRPDPVSQVLPLMGSKEGIMHISMAYLNNGDSVLVPDTGYPAYATAARICGANCITYDLSDQNNWMPDIESIEKHNLDKVKIMWVNYPNMPAGVRASARLFNELASFGRKHDILVINDNPYSFILNEKPVSILPSDNSLENVLELNSLSKSHSMAGWRLGMVIGHEKHINNILKVKSNMDSGMFLPIQKAAIRALQVGQDWYDNLNRVYRSRQSMVYDLLNSLDCSTLPDQSGMFMWSKIPGGFTDSYAFSDHCLEKYHLFVTPGLVFGSNGEKYIRTSLCVKEEIIVKAIKRIN